MSSQSSHPRIAIVGGGPGGLTLGLLLQKRRIPFTLFEFRQKPTPEELSQPSGMLDLHTVSGIAAIKACGLYDDFLPLTGECSEDFLIADKHGKIVHGEDDQAQGDPRPEISRNNLTNLLQNNIPAGNVRWGQKLISATRATDSNEITLGFDGHTKETFDLVVGADGAWSKVRGLLTDVKPNYSGLQIITLTIKHITAKYPHLAKLVGSGSFTSLGNQRGVVSQRGPHDSSRLYIFLKNPDEHFGATSGLASCPAIDAKGKLFSDDSLLKTFGPIIKDLVATGCKEETADHPGANLDIRPLYSLPIGMSWEHKSNVTVIGDAAHLMCPNGEGVNLAMQDALLLSQAVGKAYDSAGKDVASFHNALGPLLKEFETEMVARAEKTGEETRVLLQAMFGGDGPQGLLDLFKVHYQQQLEQEQQQQKK